MHYTITLSDDSGEAMNLVYDILRQLTADDLREFRRQAVVGYIATGDTQYALIAYQCHETCSRWAAGTWDYHHHH